MACDADATWFYQEGFEGQMNEDNIELGIVDDNGFRRLEVSAYVLVVGSALANNSSSASQMR